MSGLVSVEQSANEAMAMAVRFRSGKPTANDLDCMARAMQAWMSGKGDVSLERCLRLPNTPESFRSMERDHWLCEAAKHFKTLGSWPASIKLADEWAAFISHGPWRLWRDDCDPPADASSLSRCLFYATRCNRGRSVGERQVNRIIRHTFPLQMSVE